MGNSWVRRHVFWLHSVHNGRACVVRDRRGWLRWNTRELLDRLHRLHRRIAELDPQPGYGQSPEYLREQTRRALEQFADA